MSFRKRRNPNQDESGRDVKSVKTEPKPTPKPEDKLILALDFGTTFSGIAYSFKRRENPKVDVHAITNWPGAEGQAVPKVPTAISYSDYGRSFKWGASVDKSQVNALPVKLLLDPSQVPPVYLPSVHHKRLIKNLPKPPAEIAADFISAIYKHALHEIAKTVPKDYFMSCAKEFVLTVPAIWSDLAKDATRKAAEMAGMSPVTMIKEPEAAALHTMHSLNYALQVGDSFVLCDAGGGTVDLITYEVVMLEPVLELRELVPGTGSMAGSIGLNLRFAEAVKSLVGEDKFVKLRKTKGYRIAMETFDQDVKRRFKGDAEEEYLISFPMADLKDDEYESVRANCWAIKGIDLKRIFEPLVADILRLIDDQIKTYSLRRGTDGVGGIFMVGGFGSSQFLKSQIETRFPGVQVIQPTDAWTAVAKGSVEQVPRNRGCHWNLGYKTLVRLVERFDAATHAGMRIVYSHDTGEQGMRWLIKIGDDIQRDQKICYGKIYHPLTENYQPSDLLFHQSLVECSNMNAPAQPSEADSTIRTICQLDCNLQSLPWEKFETFRNENGDVCNCIGIDFVIELKSAVMTFSAEVDGKTMASVEAKYD